MYDVIIVGAGAAGLTAGVFARRRGLKALIISKDIGGQTALTHEVENYPGASPVSGFDLMEKFRKDALKSGCEIVLDEANVLGRENQIFVLGTVSGDMFKAKTVLLALGLTPRDLGVPGEEKYRHCGIHYGNLEDPERYRGTTVAIIGGGNSALDAAWRLSKICNNTYIVHRGGSFKADSVLIDRIHQVHNCSIMYNAHIERIVGREWVESVLLQTDTGPRAIHAQGLVVCVGSCIQTKWLRPALKMNERGYVEIDHNNMTSVPGVFAAGDVSSITEKQIVISAGEGARAAISIYTYLKAHGGKPAVAIPDWGRR